MNEIMLEIRNLSCGYDSKNILHGINFDVRNKELVGIIGPNGSGKTTLLRSISRIIKPANGTITLEGMDMQKMLPKKLAKEIAVVSQSFEAADMSVEEFVLLGRTPYYKRFQFVESRHDLDVSAGCMSLTDTLKIKDQLIDQTSGGERQLASIARALAQEPTLLLLDEPTSHLDITHKVAVLDLIKRLNKNFGLTVIMVLHDLNLAAEYCDRLVLLDKGEIAQIGPPREVLSYKTIERVYKTVVVVEENPVTKKPYVFLVPGGQQT